jgi:hypothetical protein
MLSPRDLATVLAALRFYQRHGPFQPNSLWDRLEVHERDALDAVRTDSGTLEPLDPGEIDCLCEKLNTTPSLSELVDALRKVAESNDYWTCCSGRCDASAVLQDIGPRCRELVEQFVHSGWDDLLTAGTTPCDCELPGDYCSGVPGIIAHVVDGRLPPHAAVERCDACRRYPSDDAARDKLRDLGMC